MSSLFLKVLIFFFCLPDSISSMVALSATSFGFLLSVYCCLFTDMPSLYLNADPYLNTDAGTMSPFEHGEVFVLDDGGEVLLFGQFLSK